ncbi:MAG: hypothetical protein EBX81_05385 [bacterium]|nr:hypothetical protein [Candidatus Aquidulcis sp.]
MGQVRRLRKEGLELTVEGIRFGDPSRLMELHRMAERGLGVGELHVAGSKTLPPIVCQPHPFVRRRQTFASGGDSP